MHVYNPANHSWTNLSAPAVGSPPLPRCGHGFTEAGGHFYVYGGFGNDENGGLCLFPPPAPFSLGTPPSFLAPVPQRALGKVWVLSMLYVHDEDQE